MTRYTPLWVQPGVYNASLDRQLLASIWPSPASSGLAVTVSSGQTLNIAPGVTAIPSANATGTTLGVSDAVEQVTLAGPPVSGTARIDLVTAQARANDLDGGSNNDLIFTFVTGTASASPVAPATPAGMVCLYQATTSYTGTTTLIDVRPWGLNPILNGGFTTSPGNLVTGQGPTPVPPIRMGLAGDTNARFVIAANGSMGWGPGTASEQIFTDPSQWNGGTAVWQYYPYDAFGSQGVEVTNSSQFIIDTNGGSWITALGSSSFILGYQDNTSTHFNFRMLADGEFYWADPNTSNYYVYLSQYSPTNGLLIEAKQDTIVPLSLQPNSSTASADLLRFVSSGYPNPVTTYSGFDVTGRPYLGAAPSWGAGTGPMMFFGNATAAPTGNPTGGVILFSAGGVLKARDPSGAVTQLAPATNANVVAPLTLTAPTASTVPLTLVGAASQTGDLLDLKNSGGTKLSWFDSNGMLTQAMAGAGNTASQVQVAGDTNPRFTLWANGQMQWGPGNAALDVGLGRIAAWILNINGALQISAGGPTTGNNLQLTGQANQAGAMLLMSAGSGATSNLIQVAGVSGSSFYLTSNATILSTAGSVSSFSPAIKITASATTDVPLTLQGVASQTGNMLTVNDSGGSFLAGILAAGTFYNAPVTTGASSFYTFVRGDGYARYTVTNTGVLNFGPGNAGADIRLYRGTTSSLYLQSLSTSLNSSLAIIGAGVGSGVQLTFANDGTSSWMFYQNTADPNFYFRDTVNAKMQVIFRPGASTSASQTEINSNLLVDGYTGHGIAPVVGTWINMKPTATTDTGLLMSGITSQTGDFFQVKDSGGNRRVALDANFNWYFVNPSTAAFEVTTQNGINVTASGVYTFGAINYTGWSDSVSTAQIRSNVNVQFLASNAGPLTRFGVVASGMVFYDGYNSNYASITPPAANTLVNIVATYPSRVPLYIKQAPSTTVDTLQMWNSAATPAKITWFDVNGYLNFGGNGLIISATNSIGFNNANLSGIGQLYLTDAAAATVKIATQIIPGDTNHHFEITTDGTHNWASGSGAQDVNLKRTAVGVLTVGRGAAGDVTLSVNNPGFGGDNWLYMYRGGAGAEYMRMLAAAGGGSGINNVYTIDRVGNSAATTRALWFRYSVDGTNYTTMFGLDTPNVNGGGVFIGSSPSWGGGTGSMIFLGNDTADPSANPTGGVILFSSAGVLKARDPSGAVTQIAPAVGGVSFPLTDGTSNNAANPEYQTRVSGDTNYRFSMTTGGVLSWGPGTAGFDVSLQRNNPGSLTLTGNLVIANQAAVSNIPLTLQGMNGQTGDLLDFQTYTAVKLGGVNATGQLYLGATPSFAAGTGPMMFLGNDTADPTTTPTGGVIVFSSAGVLKAKDPSGAITQLAPAVATPPAVPLTLTSTAAAMIPLTLVGYSGGQTGDLLDFKTGGGVIALSVGAGGVLTATQGATGNIVEQSLVSADTYNRFARTTGGAMSWGPGTANWDVQFYRSGTGIMSFAGNAARAALNVAGGIAITEYTATSSPLTLIAAGSQTGPLTAWQNSSGQTITWIDSGGNYNNWVAGDSVARFNIAANGSTSWGPGGSTGRDTNLYRSGVGILTVGGLSGGYWDIGTSGYGATFAGLTYHGLGSASYALLQDSSGNTYLNAATSALVYIRNNNANILTASGSAVAVSQPTTITNPATTTVPLTISGIASQTGDFFDIKDSGGNRRLWMDSTYKLNGQDATYSGLTLSGPTGVYMWAGANAVLGMGYGSAWTDSVNTAQMNIGPGVANALLCGGQGNPLSRLGLLAYNMMFYDGVSHAYNAIPPPTDLVDIWNTTAAKIPLVIKLAASQSADSFQIWNSAATPVKLFGIGANGAVAITDVAGGEVPLNITLTTAGILQDAIHISDQLNRKWLDMWISNTATGIDFAFAGASSVAEIGVSNGASIMPDAAQNDFLIRAATGTNIRFGINGQSASAMVMASTGGVTMTAQATTTTPLTIKEAASQSAVPFQILNSASAVLLQVSPAGSIILTGTPTATLSLSPTGGGGCVLDINNGTNEWYIYSNPSDANLYVRDIKNSRMQATFSPGASAAAANTQFGSNVGVDGYLSLVGAAANTIKQIGLVTGDTYNRFQLTADGSMYWGGGSAANDTSFYRGGVGGQYLTLQSSTLFFTNNGLAPATYLITNGYICLAGGSSGSYTGTVLGQSGGSYISEFNDTQVTIGSGTKTAIGGKPASWNGGTGPMVFLANDTADPTADPTTGVMLYSSAGVLKMRAQGGLPKISTPDTELILEQTGDTIGVCRLHLRNRGGMAGALFENPSINLVDFAFLPQTTAQANLRLEGRSGNFGDSGNATYGEFQMMLNALGGLKQAWFGTSSAGFAGALSVGGYPPSWGGGTGPLLFLANDTADPTAAPTGGTLIFSTGGILKARTPDGSITPIAPANVELNVALVQAVTLPAYTATATTLTATANGALVVDGVTVTAGQRILYANDSSSPGNCDIYTVTTVGSGTTAWVLTRTNDKPQGGTMVLVSAAGYTWGNSVWQNFGSFATQAWTMISPGAGRVFIASLATAAALPAYTGTIGSLTATANGALTLDGVAVANANVVLVKNEASGQYNGLYNVQQTGSGTLPWILSRSLISSSPPVPPAPYVSGSTVLVANGTTQAGTEWVLTTAPPVLIGTTAQTWTGVKPPPARYTYNTTLATPTVAGSPYTINHALNTTNVFVQLWDATTLNLIMAQIHIVDANNIQVSFSANAPNNVNVVVLGGAAQPAASTDYATKGYVDARTANLPAPVTTGTTVQTFTDALGDVWMAKNGVNSGAWARANNQMIARAVLGTATISGLTPLPITLPANIDPWGCMSATVFTCAVAGTYQVNAVISVTGVPAANGPNYRIQKNAADYTNITFYASTSYNYGYSLSDIMPLAVGDTVRCAVGNTGGTATSGLLSLVRIGN